MLATSKAQPDENILMYFDPEFAEDPKSPSSSARQERRDASRFDGQRGRGGKTELGWLITGAPDEDVGHSSSFVHSEIKIVPHGSPAPPTGREGAPRVCQQEAS